MSKVRMKKITAMEIMKGSADLLGDERPSMLRGIQIKKVGLKYDRYYLYFMVKGFTPIRLTASMVRTLAEAFGDDCNDWKGKPVTLVDFGTELLVPEQDFTAYVDDDETPGPRKGKPELSIVPRSWP
jgi:hypothetical protein